MAERYQMRRRRVTRLNVPEATIRSRHSA